jgi:OmpA-OmpF porin, OOP family
MWLGNFDLTVFSSALLCFATIVTPTEAAPQRPWIVAAFDRVLRAVNNESQAETTPQKEVAKQIEQAYLSKLTKEEGTITLRGHVPSESDLRILQGVAAATSPGSSVVDRSHVNSNVPNRDSWLAAMTFALRQLGKLQSGSAVLRNTAIMIEGVTRAEDDFALVQRKLREEAPKGLKLQVALKPHDVHPFIWLAQLQPGSINLSGHVPDQQDQVLCSHAQTLFHTFRVNNGMEVAKGEPEEWLAATKVALEMLSLLYTGNVAVSDTVVKLEGLYVSPSTPDELKAYKNRLPKGYTLETNVFESVARAPAARAEDVSLVAHQSEATFNP